MPWRILAGVGTLLGLIALLWWAHGTRDVAWRIADGMAGQRWYQLTLADEHIGYLASQTESDANGSWSFSSDLRFAMSERNPVQIKQRLTFAPHPPYALILGHYQLQRGSNQVEIKAKPLPGRSGAFTLHIASNGENATKEVNWPYALHDYLAFELWLATTQPQPGARFTVHTPDFERLALVPKVMELKAQSAAGYQVTNPAPQADSIIELNANFVPRRLLLAGLFDLRLTDRASALAPRSKLQHASYHVPLDSKLPDHERLASLTLKPQPPENQTWRRTLTLKSNQLSSTAPPQPADLSATPEFPANNPRLLAVLDELNLSREPSRQVDQLLSFVHSFLRYNDNAGTTPVVDLLTHREGDCTEYADLFTTLARAAKLPARTVYGLAYTDSPEPALSFHAWNEVFLNQQWESVDPTWNQRPTDATHLLLPTEERAALSLLTGRSQLEFKVLDKTYHTP